MFSGHGYCTAKYWLWLACSTPFMILKDSIKRPTPHSSFELLESRHSAIEAHYLTQGSRVFRFNQYYTTNKYTVQSLKSSLNTED